MAQTCCERRCTTGTSPSARAWSRSPAGRCPCSTQGDPGAQGRAGRRRCLRRLAHGRVRGRGPRATELLQATLSNDLEKIQPGQAQYTLLTNDRGGIIDDLIAYRLDEFRYLLIVNAANREVDSPGSRSGRFQVPTCATSRMRTGCSPSRAPGARTARSAEARQFTFAEGELDGIECMVNRTGYTGESGCELLVMAEDAGALWDSVLKRGAVPCGLGARDTLRLEASLPIHGNDITQDTDAISAGLGWCCDLDKEFSGAQELRELKARGPERKLVSFVMEEKAVPRQGMPVEGGGEVTSGTHSPMLDRGIGMGYVPVASAAPDTELAIDVRGKSRRARVVKRPIYKREE
jgi:aminomethyltransferase